MHKTLSQLLTIYGPYDENKLFIDRLNSIDYNGTISCAPHEKDPYAICGQRMPISCASMPSNLGIICSSTYTTVSTDSVSVQRRPRSACAFAQAENGLRRPQIT